MRTLLNRMSIPQVIVLGYLSLVLFGGALLSLPVSSNSQTWTSYLDSVFTATSALCVTGQVVLNTAQHWSPFGKVVIISLIEIGGIGFMTLWMFAIVLRGLKSNLRQRRIVLETLNLDADYDIADIVKYILTFTLSAQMIGAAILMIPLVPRFGWQKGIAYALFHSISAFNNAGFDLFGDSLIGFQNHPLVLWTIALLIISGGLGFLVWRDVLTFYRNRKLLRYTKLILIATTILLLGGTTIFAISESRWGTFANVENPWNWISNIFFMAATPRTAGYANIDYAHVSHAGIFTTIVLMFIGGASGSTAGGVKVSTIAIATIYLYRTFKEQPIMIYSREIRDGIVRKAFFIIFAGIGIIMLATLILLMTETVPQPFGIEYIMMEVVSCFSTVGLTMGLTPHLSEIGKVVLIILMLMGRVGLITFLWSIGDHRYEWKIKYPEMSMMIG